MTTEIALEHTFTASIKARGENRQGTGWVLTPNWKLPGSQYELVLYGKDWEDIEGWAVGDTAIFTIHRGNLRPNKDGKFASDYYWDLADIENPGTADHKEQSREQPSSPARMPPPPSPSLEREEPPPNPAALGACQNHAVDFIVAGITPLPEGRTLESFIRELRDRFYRNINQAPLAPPHYCYQHEAERKQSPKTHKWGHVLEDGTGCVEDLPE